METDATAAPNPWFTMWTRPRATIQRIIDQAPERQVILLAALSGVAQSLNKATEKNLGDEYSLAAIFLMALIIGPVVGILSLFILGFLVHLTGSWIGGLASRVQVRAALAWGSVPTIWSMLLWIPGLALAGKEMFTTETPMLDDNLGATLALLGLAIGGLVLAIWAIVVVLKSLGQVQGFSAWKALGNLLLSMLPILVPILILVLLGAVLGAG